MWLVHSERTFLFNLLIILLISLLLLILSLLYLWFLLIIQIDFLLVIIFIELLFLMIDNLNDASDENNNFSNAVHILISHIVS